MRARSLTDGRTFEGRDAAQIVAKMRDVEPIQRRLSVEDYMQRVRGWTGKDAVRTESPEAFLESLSELGLVELE